MSDPKPVRAALVHHMPGRARLRLRSDETDADETAVLRLSHAIGEYPAVHEAKANLRARSLLILHTGEIASILDDAQARGLLLLEAEKPRARPTMRAWRNAIEDADQRIMDGTDRSVSLAGVAFYALAAAGIWQTLNGQLLPPGATLFNFAWGAMQWGAKREPPTSAVTGA